jgi:sulfur carrier protein ThiS
VAAEAVPMADLVDLEVAVQEHLMVVEDLLDQQTLEAAAVAAALTVVAEDREDREELELKNLQYLRYQQYLKLWLQMESGN